MTTVLYVLLAILVLELLIFIHELGHYTAGKLLGFRILGFSLGFGPALFKFRRGETEYALRAIPFGGACQFDGEDEEAENDPRRFNANPVWKRLIVIFAGPFMNILTAFVIAFVLHLATPQPIYALNQNTGEYLPSIESVVKGGAAERAGLKAGDVLVSVDGEVPSLDGKQGTIDAFVNAISKTDGEFALGIERCGEELTLDVKDAYNEKEKRTLIGVTIAPLVEGTRHLNVWESFTGSGEYLFNIVKMTGQAIGGMFKNGIKRGDVSGVVGTVGIMASEARKETVSIVYIAVILSLSLGIFNLIPFPALDGGRLLFLLIEAVIGRPLNRKVEGIVNGVGLALLFGLMIVVTISDILGLFGK